MKIAIIADALENQGAGVHVFTREMVRALWANRGEHEMVLVLGEDHSSHFPSIPKMVIPRPSLPGYSSWRLFVSIPRRLAKEGVDLVLEPAHFGPFGLPDSILRATLIHDLTPLLFPQLHRWHSQILQRLFLPRILRKADCIITNSLYTEKDVHRVFPFTQGKTLQIYPGMPPSEASSQEEEGPPTFSKPYFLMVGTLEPRKNHRLVLSAFVQLQKSSGAQYALVITGGKGWKSKAIYRALEQHPYRSDIHLTGYVPSSALPSLYQRALALLYPSSYEGFGLPILEAMHYGTLVLTCRNSSLTEVGGPHAFYLDGMEAEELCSKMRTLAETPPEVREMLLAKYKEHSKQFSWEASAFKMWRAFEQLSK
jgi:glycosyltransferase involved in cell wall biosynthesis